MFVRTSDRSFVARHTTPNSELELAKNTYMISIDFSADRRLILRTNYLQEGQKAVYGCTAHIGIY